MSAYATAVLTALATVMSIVYLLRSRRIREKYAVAWIAFAIGVVLLAVFPQMLAAIAGFLGVETPINLVFLVAALALLVVCVQFSVEISTLEEETRTLAEELAILRFRVDELEASGRDTHAEG